MPPKKGIGKETSRNVNKKRGAQEPAESTSQRSHKNARRDSNQDKENNHPQGSKSPTTGPSKQTADNAPTNTETDIETVTKPNHAPYDYICINRPYFDVQVEYRRKSAQGETGLVDEDEVHAKLYQPGWEEEKRQKIFMASPKDHPDHKWMMMWSAWSTYCDLGLRAKYCDPDNFDMYIYNDFRGYGMQEILVEQLNAFDKALRKLDDGGLDKMWSIVSAIGLWTNFEDCDGLINTDDGDACLALVGLLGCALLTVLSTIVVAGELKPRTPASSISHSS